MHFGDTQTHCWEPCRKALSTLHLADGVRASTESLNVCDSNSQCPYWSQLPLSRNPQGSRGGSSGSQGVSRRENELFSCSRQCASRNQALFPAIPTAFDASPGKNPATASHTDQGPPLPEATRAHAGGLPPIPRGALD